MKLKSIYLYPDLVEFRDQSALTFRNQTRYICNFLQKSPGVLNFDTEGFSRICFVCKTNPVDACYVNSSGALAVEIKFDFDQYLSIRDEDLAEYFIGLILLGVDKCLSYFSIPAESIIKGIDLFRDMKYRNEWIFCEKNFRGEKIKARLTCQLNINEFNLYLTVFSFGEEIFNEIIITTIPDEICYLYKFKNIELRDGSVVVLDKSKNVVFDLILNKLRG